MLPSFATTINTTQVTVTLPGYTYAVGDTFPILTQTMVGGITLYGNYIVQTLIDANTSRLSQRPQQPQLQPALSMAVSHSSSIRSARERSRQGLDTESGRMGAADTAPAPRSRQSTGTKINALDWTMDNFGRILLRARFSRRIRHAVPTDLCVAARTADRERHPAGAPSKRWDIRRHAAAANRRMGINANRHSGPTAHLIGATSATTTSGFR